MRFSSPKAIAFLLLAALSASPASGEETRELDSHEHGHVTMQIAVDGSDVAIALEAPGENIVGFEHAPASDEQRAAVDAALKQLENGSAIVTLPPDAQCEQTSTRAELHQDGDHMAFEAAYAFACENISALGSVETGLFELYPSIEEIDVEYATPAGQGAAELEADDPVVALGTSN